MFHTLKEDVCKAGVYRILSTRTAVDAPKGSDLVSRVNRLHLRQVWTPPHLGITERNQIGLAEYRRWNLIACVVSNLLSILACLPHRSFKFTENFFIFIH